jgi:D-alanine-D-alanine ligase
MIVILKGGTSAEREVSLWTAETIAAALQTLKQPFQEIDQADVDWLDQVRTAQPRCVLIALHGPHGEDGMVQQALDGAGIRYAGSGVEASQLCIDKQKTKEYCRTLGIRIPAGQLVTKADDWRGELPVVVKPNRDGSSYGVTIAHTKEQFEQGIEAAQAYGSEVLVEEYLEGMEVTCGVIDITGEPQSLPLVMIQPAHEFFDFYTKYAEGGAIETCPAPLPSQMTELIQGQSLDAYEALGLRHYARFDWILRENIPYFIEVNTLPGMTKTSLLPKELHAAGIRYEEFIAELIAACS